MQVNNLLKEGFVVKDRKSKRHASLLQRRMKVSCCERAYAPDLQGLCDPRPTATEKIRTSVPQSQKLHSANDLNGLIRGPRASEEEFAVQSIP